MELQELVGNILPIVLALVAVVLILQSLFERDSEAEEDKNGSQGPQNKEKEKEKEEAGEKASEHSGGVKLKKVVSPPNPTDLLYDFSADIDDLASDDSYEITKMGEVPKELVEQMKGRFVNCSTDPGVSREQVKELFLITGVARSDRGIHRQVNEDAYLVIEDEPLFLVADGMGGYKGGDIASKLAVEVIEKAFKERKFDGPVNTEWPRLGDELVRTFHQAHEAVKACKVQEPKYIDMGTTAVAVRFSEDKTIAYIASCGDSRCYRLRKNKLKQLTTDHTLGTLLGIKGKAGRRLTQAIGVHDSLAVDLNVDEPRAEDMYLVCSDGLTKMVDDDTILKIIQSPGELETKARGLIDESNARGGKDNITVIVIRIEEAR